MMNQIPVIRSSMPPKEEYLAEIASIWETKWLTNHGKKVEELEKKAADVLDADYAMCTVNGHQALELALRSLDLEGEVITTPFTFVSTTAAIVRCGLKPVFCDISEDDFTLNPDKIETLITDKTCAILPVHVYGNICDDEKIREIANRYGLKVIYDAAHAFGVKYHGEGVGALGDISMFSLHATKVLNSIEGGILSYHDENLNEKLWQLQNFGITGPETVKFVGTNAKMNEFSAAMGICNLRHLDEYIAARKKAYEHYIKRLAGLRGIRLNLIKEDVESNYAYFPILVEAEEIGFDRDHLAELLAENGIGTRKYFAPLTSDFECYRQFRNTETPVADKISKQVLTLPMYSELLIEDVDRICDIICKAAYQNGGSNT